MRVLNITYMIMLITEGEPFKTLPQGFHTDLKLDKTVKSIAHCTGR